MPFLYGLFFLAILGMYIASFIMEPFKDLLLWCILGTSSVASLLGAWAVYRYDVVADHIDQLKDENHKYEREIGQLTETRKDLKKEVTKLDGTVQHLQNDAQVLDSETHAMEALVGDLKGIAEKNEDLQPLLQNTNKIFNNLRTVMLENEQAHLLSTFYRCAFRDGDRFVCGRHDVLYLNVSVVVWCG